LNNKGQLTATASPAQPRRHEILLLATATAFYGGGGNFLRLATAYELYGGLRRRLGGLMLVIQGHTWPPWEACSLWLVEAPAKSSCLSVIVTTQFFESNPRGISRQ